MRLNDCEVLGTLSADIDTQNPTNQPIRRHVSNESDVQAVQRTFELILPLADTFVAMFYDRFFAAEPEARPLFTTDMQIQRMKVIDMLALAVHGLDDPDAIQEELSSLGHRHVDYRVEVHHYASMNDAILDALGDCLGEQFTPEIRAAWAKALDLVTQIMIGAHSS